MNVVFGFLHVHVVHIVQAKLVQANTGDKKTVKIKDASVNMVKKHLILPGQSAHSWAGWICWY